jgi:hypothetical protein
MTTMVPATEATPVIELTPEVIAFLRTHVVTQVHEPTEAEMLADYYQVLANPKIRRDDFEETMRRVMVLRNLMQWSL